MQEFIKKTALTTDTEMYQHFADFTARILEFSKEMLSTNEFAQAYQQLLLQLKSVSEIHSNKSTILLIYYLCMYPTYMAPYFNRTAYCLCIAFAHIPTTIFNAVIPLKSPPIHSLHCS